MWLRPAALMEGDLNARNTRHPQRLIDLLRRRMTVAGAVGSEQEDAVSLAAVGVGASALRRRRMLKVLPGGSAVHAPHLWTCASTAQFPDIGHEGH
jgi:hypothetical protein